MASFISHPLFGAGASYILCKSQQNNYPSQFIILSILCQWIPDVDTLSYLFPIDERHPLGHRGLMHSGAFAFAFAFAVMTIFYRPLKLNRVQWWRHYTWFVLMTLSHGIFDGLVASSLGIAYFWPIDVQRYHLAWQPLIDVPIRFAELFGAHFWYAQWIECQFFSCLLASLYIALRMRKSHLHRLCPPVLPAGEAASEPSSNG